MEQPRMLSWTTMISEHIYKSMNKTVENNCLNNIQSTFTSAGSTVPVIATWHPSICCQHDALLLCQSFFLKLSFRTAYNDKPVRRKRDKPTTYCHVSHQYRFDGN